MAATSPEVLGAFHGDESFPIEWRDGERELFWVLDDLHCPNPVSPMFFDIGGWWLTCDHMFRRFGTPFAADWVAKRINGYVYTAAIPATPGARPEAEEYGNRYAPRVPLAPEYAAKIGRYLEWTLPYYAENFMVWWRERFIPEMDRNFARLDGADTGAASLVELAVLLEDAMEIHDRHWKIHWLLNFAEFSARSGLEATVKEVCGVVDSELLGRLQSSVQDRNWDAVRDLWEIKGEVKADPELAAAFTRSSAADVRRALAETERGRRLVDERITPHQKTFGYKSIWSHEVRFRLWVEDPAPILEAIRGYVAADYDFPASLQAVKDDLQAAQAELLEPLQGEQRERVARALELSLGMNPLTPDHHFYIDQGTNARLRLVLMAIGDKLEAAEVLDDREDVAYLRYQELRMLMADPTALGDVKELVSDRRDEIEDSAQVRPPAWVGTATEEALAFPYWTNWGFPDRFHAGPAQTTGEVRGLGASPGVIEGTARWVSSSDEFDQVRTGEILVCRMTNPAWVVLFTKIGGLVTEAGGTSSHPAVVAREFGIPAVVGTNDAGARIKTGDRVRVNGTTGVVELLT
ncbi:MAG: Phosphoenolpyruvate-utilizing enzyme mobile region [Conexibacter sp.]|nr:Phosphoenolpyruvate-utilizing enzyme mobile region [Conexibacter sp.]